MAARHYRRLQGLFCVYKPPGVHWKLVRDTVETNLLKDLNASASRPVPREVRYLLSQDSTKDEDAPKALTLSAASVPVLSKHPLVTGPDFQHIKVGVGHRLDAFSSGVLVLGIGNANKVLNDLYNSRVTRDYTVEGVFGSATDDFSNQGRIIERSTYSHITQDKLEKVLAMLQGANQKALLTYSRVDMRSQEAYEMAVQGLLGPEEKSVPILLRLRCICFEPPNFTLDLFEVRSGLKVCSIRLKSVIGHGHLQNALKDNCAILESQAREVQVINETQKYLCKVVHEIGLELRSTAVCKGIRRTRDGRFTVHHALTHNQWTAAEVMNAIQQCHTTKKRKRDTREQNKNSELHVEERDISTSQNTTHRIDAFN